MYKGVARDLTNAIDTINKSEPYNIKHMCTRAVSNALEGIRDVHRASGVADPRAMYNMLKKDGWVDVLDEKDKYGHWIYKGICNVCGYEKYSHYGSFSGAKSMATVCTHIGINGKYIKQD